ncbi:MAG: phosphatase PAP2 family protein [Bacteroidetes bacterium]|nr:phosphatase PAP2 family protein [Bacteroidota bacterium]
MNIINTIKSIDTELFLFLNSKHNAFFDVVMFWASHRYFWIPLYIFFFYLAFRFFGKKVILVALATVLLIVLADQISVHAFKNVFLRYRPCHNLLLQAQVHLNDGCGGTYGFISSHAANTFALAMFLSLLFKNKIKYFGLFIFIWAAFVSYSRIYNGVHYPADVAVGSILGMGIGIVVFKSYQLADHQLGNKIK